LPKRAQNIRTVKIALGNRSYPIQIGSGARRRFGDLFKKHGSGRAFWITDRNVARLWGKDLKALWKSSPAPPIILPPGEDQKRLCVVEDLCRKLTAAGAERGDTLIALGGGVIGDLVGFTAACYLRGIAFVQIPTTLLAMVDSSVGGKTGVDLPEGKNLVGAFHQPRFVLADVDFLGTLPHRELVSGLAEVVKTAIIGDRELFIQLKHYIKELPNLEIRVSPGMIAACAAFKAGVVREDERESGRRRLLNFGHTVGHALERMGEYRALRHGEALFWGMYIAIELSERLKLLPPKTAGEIQELLDYFLIQIPGITFQQKTVYKVIQRDKKVRGGRTHFVLLEDIAKPIISDRVTTEQLISTLKILRQKMRLGGRRRR